MSNIAPKLRCAIYTRKSSEEGLDQSFNSLDAQREACEAYIASQTSMGWKLLPEFYDDGGISGGTMERPALQRLLSDIKQRTIDVVVVYKIDRLTRSLMDFSRIVEIFDGHGVSFVSITQQFNTTTSMGRLTLNVLLSFAQFEREVTAERIRDKVAASKKKGMWMGGNIPLGYRVHDRKLIVDEQEAETVRWLFRRYLDLKSLTDLSREAKTNGLHRNENRKITSNAFGRGKLHHLLTNPVYAGKVRHKDAIYDGEHQAIVDDALFSAVQDMLTSQAPKRRSSTNHPERHLLGHLLRDEHDRPFLLAHAANHGRRYRYYVSRAHDGAAATKLAKATGEQWRLPAEAIERIVADQVRQLLADKTQLSKWLEPSIARLGIATILAKAAALNYRYDVSANHSEKQQILRHLFARIVVMPERITFEVRLGGLVTLLGCASGPDTDPVAQEEEGGRIVPISIPLQMKRRGVEGKFVLQGSTTQPASKDPMLIGLIAKAHLYLEALTDGSGASHQELADRLGLNGPDISRILPMAFLSPKITEAILTGRQPFDLTIAKLTRTIDLPMIWKEQQVLLDL